MTCEPSRQPIEVRLKVERLIVSTSLLVPRHRYPFFSLTLFAYKMDAILDGGWGAIKRQDLRDPLGLCPTLVLLMCCRSLGDR